MFATVGTTPALSQALRARHNRIVPPEHQEIERENDDEDENDFGRRRCSRLEIQVVPVGHLILMVSDEFDCAVLRNHDREAGAEFAAKTVGGAVAGSGAFH
jgi:hypothetical protein